MTVCTHYSLQFHSLCVYVWIIVISNNCYELNRNFNEVLCNPLIWFQAYQLVLNMEKINIVKLTPANFSDFVLLLTFAEHLPVKTNAVKFLGLQLDGQLSWNHHINYLLYKLSSVSSIRRKLSHILYIQTVRTVYFRHFHPLVNHGIIFWGNTSSMHKVFLTPEKILKTML